MPRYTNATYAGDTKILKNDFMRVEVHNRKTGWAWIEIYTPEDKLMGVLPYLGALQDNEGSERGNMAAFRRLESSEVREESTEKGDSMVFDVHALTNYDLARGSFVEYMSDKNESSPLTGTIRLILARDKGVLSLDYDLFWTGNNGFVTLRGPWLLAGADSFGQVKTDAIFPGIEWLRAGEWSSSHNYMLPPLSDRTAPHPFKVSSPVMAVSHDGDGIGLAWDPMQPLVARRPMNVMRYPQPVFSSPDAVNHADQHLMGLMLPTSAATGVENDVFPKRVTSFPRNAKITFNAEIFLTKGCSLDVLADWVQRHGLPEPPAPRRSLGDALDFIAQNYDGHLWIDHPEQKGWGIRLERDMARFAGGSTEEPAHMRRYLKKYGETERGQNLARKFALASQNPSFKRPGRDPFHLDSMRHDELIAYGEGLLSIQQENGCFLFEPSNKRSAAYSEPGIVHWPFAENLHKELCTEGDVTLETNAVSALHLLRLAALTQTDQFNQAAYRALDFCMPMLVPDGGDSWETPLHSPNLLATGHAGIAYELAYRASGEKRFREKAIYWLRGLLVFTHLWEPINVHDLYCTKPCLCATDWATTSWVDTHVQWEVIQCLALAKELGIDWHEVDPAIDWHRYSEGIACAATHWMLDKSRAGELPFDIDLQLGNLDGLIADAHDPITGENFGWQLMPDYLANLIMDVLESRPAIDSAQAIK